MCKYYFHFGIADCVSPEYEDTFKNILFALREDANDCDNINLKLLMKITPCCEIYINIIIGRVTMLSNGEHLASFNYLAFSYLAFR